MARKVTRIMAEKALAAIEVSLGVDTKYGGPEILEQWDGYDFVICWEGGWCDWTFIVSGGGFDEYGHENEPTKMPAGVWFEPVNGCILALYRV